MNGNGDGEAGANGVDAMSIIGGSIVKAAKGIFRNSIPTGEDGKASIELVGKLSG